MGKAHGYNRKYFIIGAWMFSSHYGALSHLTEGMFSLTVTISWSLAELQTYAIHRGPDISTSVWTSELTLSRSDSKLCSPVSSIDIAKLLVAQAYLLSSLSPLFHTPGPSAKLAALPAK